MLRTEWIKRGAFVIPYGTMSAVELSLTDIMDKMVVDDWGQCRKGLPFGALRQHVDSDRLERSTTFTPSSGRSSPGAAGPRAGRRDDPVLASRAVARPTSRSVHALLEKAKRASIGQTLRFA